LSTSLTGSDCRKLAVQTETMCMHVKFGDVVFSDDGWMTAVNSSGDKGLVPCNYLKVGLMNFY